MRMSGGRGNFSLAQGLAKLGWSIRCSLPQAWLFNTQYAKAHRVVQRFLRFSFGWKAVSRYLLLLVEKVCLHHLERVHEADAPRCP